MSTPKEFTTPPASAHLEWQQILNAKSLEEVLTLLRTPTDEGQRLRQSNPFAGLLPPPKNVGRFSPLMTREQLEHLIRAAGAITNTDDLVIVGQKQDSPPYTSCDRKVRAGTLTQSVRAKQSAST